MKSFFILVAIASTTIQNVVAQKSTIGFTAGACFSRLLSKSESEANNSDTKPGLTLGITGYIPMGKQVNFEPAINYVQKGGTINIPWGTSFIKATDRLHYLELPLNIVYHASRKKDHFFFGGGPNLAYGISGSGKSTNPNSLQTETASLHFGNTADDVAKPLEIGINVLAGYQFNKGFNVAVNYNRGLNNISSDGSTKDHTTYFTIRVGYMLAVTKL